MQLLEVERICPDGTHYTELFEIEDGLAFRARKYTFYFRQIEGVDSLVVFDVLEGKQVYSIREGADGFSKGQLIAEVIRVLTDPVDDD